MVDQSLKVTLASLLRRQGPISAADLAALVAKTSSRIPADGLIGEVLSCLRDEPRFTQREDGTWSLDVPPPASIDAKAPIRFADFPLFCAVGSTARGDETHPDFVRMPVARGLSELGLTPRVLEALEVAGICTVGDLVLTPSDRVLDVVRLIGKTRLRYLRDAVKSLATKHLADLDAEPSSGDASAGQDVPADFEGYSLDSDWDGRCPTCDNPAEATDVVTDDGDGVFRCPECNEWFYVEITSAADTEEDQSESQDGTKAEDLSVEHGETMTEDEQAGKKIVRPTDAGQVRREVGRRKQRDESVRKDASSLFQFLHDVVELRSRTVRSVDQYAKDGHVLWLTDVPRERGCLCAAWPVDDGESTAHSPWLEVARPRLEDWPEPPVVLRPWLDPVELADSSLEYPELQERVPRTRFSDEDDLAADDEGNVGYEQVEGILEMWSQYVERRWQPWAVRDGRLQPVQTLYNDLFSLHQTLQSRGDEFELIVGVGLLQWQRAGHEIKRHLLTTSAELRFESDRGRIVLEPGPEGVVLRLEQDMLEVGDRPSPDELAGIAGRLDDAGDDFWHGDDVKAVARMWVNSVAADGRFADELAPQVGGNGQPMVTWSPALILRKRTARPLLEFYENALRLLGEGEEISDGVAALVAVGGGREPDDHRPVNKEAAPDPEEVFFPLPANEEQLEILHRMNASTGVLVQGPPGTGKSHTIANLITHLLATGKRVLVTSQTPRALRVLQQKLPREIADLCVLLVGDDRDAMRDLDRSVQGITDRFNHWDADENTVLIARLEKRLDEARRRAEVRRKQLIALRESEIDEYSPVGGSYAGSLASIARRLREEQPRFGWLTVADDVDVGAEPPLSNGEARELLALVRRLGEREMDLIDQPLPSLDDIPSGDAFEILIEREAQARASCEHAHVAGDSTVVTRLTTASEDDARSLRVAVDAYRDALLTVSSASEPWAMKPLRDLLSGRGARWEALMKSCGEALTQLDALGESAAKRSVVGLDDHDLLTARHHAEMLRDHLVSGGSLGNFLRRAEPVKRAKYLIDGVRVDGRAVDCEEALSQFVAWIDVNTTLERLDAEWRPHCEVPAGTLLQRAAEYRNLQSDLTAAFSAHAKGRDAQGLLASAGVQTQCDWCDVAAVTALGMDAEAAIDSIQLTSLEGQFTNLADSLRACGPGDSPRPLLDSVVTAVRDRDAAGLRVVRRMIADAWTLRTDLARKDELLDRLSAGSQTSADRLVASIDDPDWQDRLTTFEEAWSWALADRWLDSSLSPGSLRRLSDQLDRDEQEARGVLNELAAARAWGYCFQRMTPIERMNLVAWMKAVRKIGKGKGKYAARYRREAREYLEGCRSAIPAWVMPTFRVAETIRPGQDRFDVVIIDEASQSGLESLFLHYLGDKLIVVGDDRQISPEYVGTNLQDVEDLRRRHISGLPLSPTFGVGTSLFSQAEIRFGNRVRLREHFRCMPEIIQFCNQLQYAGEPLVPLRQFGSERLEPIVVRHVGDGYQEGTASSAVNRPEVDAVVEAIKACCQDPRYDEAKMGVISLLGEAQARLVERRLLERLGAEEMERRNLVCGDAYSFQGDEREVMFLTMVSAPNARIGALASDSARRRFNVAVSRAKDQLWLFHSVAPKDLSPTCVRRALLEYCMNPSYDRIVVADLSLNDLRETSLQADRRDGGAPAPFDSWFEVDVFVRIAERGYRVAPQYSVAGFRIDMVVEGASSRLAVECDGDEVHGGIEQYEADMARQRRLERCGWTFWRVGGGEYYRDPEAALAGLWESLDRHDILPGGAARPAQEAKLSQEVRPLVEERSFPVASLGNQERAGTDGDDSEEADAPQTRAGYAPAPTADEPSAADAVDLSEHALAEPDGTESSDHELDALEELLAGATVDPDDHEPAHSNREPVDGVPETLSWEDYEAGANTWAFPELEDGQARLTAGGVDDLGSDRGVEVGGSPKSADRERSSWLRHGVLGSLPAGTQPTVSSYRVAKVQIDTFGLHLARMPRASLADAIVRVVDVESPVLIAEVAGRIARACGLKRVRRQTEKAFRDAAGYAASNRMIVQDGDVLWSKDDAAAIVRNRSSCPGELHLTESVPIVEIEWAVHSVVHQAGSIRGEDVARAVSRLLGFRRTSDVLTSRVSTAVERALDCKAMTLRHGLLSITPDDERESNLGAHAIPTGQPPKAPPQGTASESHQAGAELSLQREQARVLIRALRTSTHRRVVLDQLNRIGVASIGPLIEALADSEVAPFAVTALVEFGPLAKEELVKALDSPDIQIRIHAGEALSRAGLDEDL